MPAKFPLSMLLRGSRSQPLFHIRKHSAAFIDSLHSRPFTSFPTTLSARTVHYDPIDFAEYPGFYNPQGYHPVHLGDGFKNGRYKVANKLGDGDSSTVWLAKDIKNHSYVALKILTSSTPINPLETELPSTLNAQDCSDGRKFILTPRDVFDIQGPNGCHKCLVLPVVGPSVYHHSVNVEPLYLPLKVAKRAVLEMAKGIEYLHRNKLGHGDLHIGNILLQIPGLASWNEQQILSHFGRPVRENITRLDGLPVEPSPGLPKYSVAAAYVTKPFHFNGSIMIADFGSAFRSSQGDKSLRTSIKPAVCAPERILGHSFDLPSDIWSLGCTIFAIVSGLDPFDSMRFLGGRDSTMLDIMRTLGKPPDSWWSQWQERRKQHGVGNRESVKDAIIHRSLAEKITEIRSGNVEDREAFDLMPVREGDFSDDDIEGMVDLLSRMLVYEPSKRLTASEVLAHPWMKSLQAEVQLASSSSVPFIGR